MSKMITKVPNVTVSVKRDGKKVRALPGVAFDFTEQEIAEVEGMVPGCLRDPQNESAQVATTAEKGDKGDKGNKANKGNNDKGSNAGDNTGGDAGANAGDNAGGQEGL